MIRLLIILFFTTGYATLSSCGQVSKVSTTDSTSTWYHGEFNKNKSEIDYPLQPIGWVNDFEHILTDSQVKILDSTISVFEYKTTFEIAILTIDSSFVNEKEFDNMVTSIGRIWGVGKKDLNNGITIGISSSLKRIRISTGSGAKYLLSDNETKRIIDEIIVPYFRKADFFTGLKEGLQAIINTII